MSLDTPTPPNRRRILGSTTLGAAAGLITGLAAGVALALPPKSPPMPPQPGRPAAPKNGTRQQHQPARRLLGMKYEIRTC